MPDGALHHAAAPTGFRAARGARLVAPDGSRRLDLDNAAGAVILGHADPLLVRALARALADGCGPAAGPAPARLAAGLADRMPPGWRVALFASGEAAAGAAMALSREATGIAAVVSGATAEEAGRQLDGLPCAAAVSLDLGAEGAGLARTVANRATALLLLDARAGFLRVRDELRTAEADLVILGETLANGHPIGGLAGPPSLLARLAPMRGPDGLSVAAALAVLDRAERQDIPGGLAARGETLAQGLGCALAAAGFDGEVTLQGPAARRVLRGLPGLGEALAREGVHWRGLLAPSLALSPLELLEASAAFARALKPRDVARVSPRAPGGRA